MDIHSYVDEMKKVQMNLLNFLENQENHEENFQDLSASFVDLNIREDKHKLQLLLHLLSKICANHHHGPNFFDKVEQIIKIFSDDIRKYYSNLEIFNIFKYNKRILLFLLEEKLIYFDKRIIPKILKEQYIEARYPQYFAPEIKPFINEPWFTKLAQKDNYNYLDNCDWIKDIKSNKLPENFYELRLIGENDNLICKLIREDSIKDFIVYINRNNISLKSTIDHSIYETNSFLIDKHVEIAKNHKPGINLIQYAAFFGSIQIFQYLISNKIELTTELFQFAYHGQNPEIIHHCENIKTKKSIPYQEILLESIKSHHNDAANYILTNFLQNDFLENSDDTFLVSLKYYNFCFFQENLINSNLFYYFCKFEYYQLIDFCLKEQNKININKRIIKIRIKNGRKNEEKIIEKDDDVNIDDDDIEDEYIKSVKTALSIAVKNDNAELVKLLLSIDDIDVNIPYKLFKVSFWDSFLEKVQKAPLYLAVENENIEIVKLLLMNNKIDVNILYKLNKLESYSQIYSKTDDYFGFIEENIEKSAIYLAVEIGNIEIINLLLANDKLDINNHFIYYKTDEKCEKLEESDDGDGYKEIHKIEKTPFYLAVENDNIEIIKLLLLNDKIDVSIPCLLNESIKKFKGRDCYNWDDRNCVFDEIKKKYYETEIVCDGDKQITPFDYAFDNGKHEIAKLILQNKNIDFHKILKYDLDIYKIIFNQMGYDIIPKNE